MELFYFPEEKKFEKRRIAFVPVTSLHCPEFFFFYFLKWNGTCNGRLFLLELKWLESKEAKKKKKAATCEYLLVKREGERRRGAITRTNSIPRSDFFLLQPFPLDSLTVADSIEHRFTCKKKKNLVYVTHFFFLCNFESFDSYPVGRFE